MMKTIARTFSIIFHPIIIPTLGFLILFNANFYFALLSWETKRFILLVVAFSTAILPMISLAIYALQPKSDFRFEKSTNRIVFQLAAAIFYYIGYFLLGRMQINPLFQLFLIASALLIVLLSIISLKWKISNHMAGLGGLAGTIMALSFRLGLNPVFWITGLIITSGLVGTSRLILGKHDLPQIIAGFTLGFLVLYLTTYFV